MAAIRGALKSWYPASQISLNINKKDWAPLVIFLKCVAWAKTISDYLGWLRSWQPDWASACLATYKDISFSQIYHFKDWVFSSPHYFNDLELWFWKVQPSSLTHTYPYSPLYCSVSFLLSFWCCGSPSLFLSLCLWLFAALVATSSFGTTGLEDH